MDSGVTDRRKIFTSGRTLTLGVLVLVLLLENVVGVCVWQGGGGFRLACGFKQSGLFRLRSLGGMKGWAGAGFTIGDEDGFKDSLTNTESKSPQPSRQYPNSQVPGVQQYGQYSHVAVSQPQEIEHLQKRASLWNSWKWPSIVKKKSPTRIQPPHRMGPIMNHPHQNYPYPPPMLPSYSQHVPVIHPHPHQFPQSPYYPPPPHPQFPHQPIRIPHFHPLPHHHQSRLKELQKQESNEMPDFSPMPELDPMDEDNIESQIEPVLKALANSAEKRKRNKLKTPYGLKLLQNSENYGKKFRVSENSVMMNHNEEPPTVTGYDTNLFPDIYFTSTTPRIRVNKILETDEEDPLQDWLANLNPQESTTEAILRKLRLKKIKLLKKGHKLRVSKPKPKPTTERITTTTSKATTQKSTTTTTTPPTTTTTTTTTTPKPSPAPPKVMRTRPTPTTERPDYIGSWYGEKEGESETRQEWRYMSPTPKPTPISLNPLIQSGRWKEIYDPRYPPNHEVNRGKLELLAAALTTTSAKPRHYEYPFELDEVHKRYGTSREKPQDEYRHDDYPLDIPKQYEFPKQFEGFPDYRDDSNKVRLLSKVKIDEKNGQFVRFDSHESLDLVNRTRSYNDAFYSHFNKSAVEMSDQPSPTPFHYFSAFTNQKSTPGPPQQAEWPWDKSVSGGHGHFSRNEYILSSTTESSLPVFRPIDRWSGLGSDGSIEENTKHRIDHSAETGDLIRRKSLNLLAANWEPGRGLSEIEYPNFVTDDNFKIPKYPHQPQTTLPPPMTEESSTTLYFSSTPSYNEWKNYVSSVGNVIISSTTQIPPTTTPKPQIPIIDEKESRWNKSEVKIIEKPKKGKGNVKGSTSKVTIPTTTKKPITTTTPENKSEQDNSEIEDSKEEEIRLQEALGKKKKKEQKNNAHPKKPALASFLPVSGPSVSSKQLKTPKVPIPPLRMEPPPPSHSFNFEALPNQNIDPPPPPPEFSTSHLHEFSPSSQLNIQTDWNKHPLHTTQETLMVQEDTGTIVVATPPPYHKHRQNIDFQELKAKENEMKLKFQEEQIQKQIKIHEQLEKQMKFQQEQMQKQFVLQEEQFQKQIQRQKEQELIQRQKQFDEVQQKQFQQEQQKQLERQEQEQRFRESQLRPKANFLENQELLQRQSQVHPDIQHPSIRWNSHGPPTQNYADQISITYPHPHQHPRPHPPNGPMGYNKPIRHMIPGRPPPPMNPPSHRRMLRPPPHPQIPFHSHQPNIFPVPLHVQMATLSPPPAPPPQIIPSTKPPPTTTTPKIETKLIEKVGITGDEKEMILKALQTLTKAKSHLLHSVVNEKYGGDVAGIVKVVTEIPTQFRPTTTTITTTTTEQTTTTPRPTTPTTTPTPITTPRIPPPIPTISQTTMQTRILLDEMPSKFTPLLNYVKSLKIPHYENDKVQIDYFNFNSDEPKSREMTHKQAIGTIAPEILGLNIDDIALLASTNQAQNSDDNKFQEMLRQAMIVKKAEARADPIQSLFQTPNPTPVLYSSTSSSPSTPTLADTLAKMGLIQKIHDRNVTTTQMDTLKKLIGLHKLETRVDQVTPPPFMNNFQHILQQIPQSNRFGHRISNIDPSIPVQQFLNPPTPPPTTPKPFNSLYSAINGPTLQALKAIALNRIQNVQPTPQINYPQQTAPQEQDEEEENDNPKPLTVDLSAIFGIPSSIEQINKKYEKRRISNVRNAPKSYYPGDRTLSFDNSFGNELYSDFDCERQEFFPGLYGDSDNSCKAFHLCAKTDAGYLHKTFRCPQGTLFDQEVLRCNWSLYVDCKNVESKYSFNKYLSQSFQFLKSLGEFSANYQSQGINQNQMMG